ncbi:response regulator [Paenibacillus sp. 1011MAR3C5]|uniref:ATP-binding protein n=1 Tax=Paenibacillus sp. 1011MAR3C5 TaxID=1675787 RepID=UPI000E6CD527|nr:ATP-binding protein [Paenibacillus sp. 1011MAR3C5]RJE87480.1 response regulator [Paenibacillus sp. 1011MAR3C5]
MNTKKLILLTFLFIIALTSIRMMWYSTELFQHQPKAEKGQLDLRNWQPSSKRVIALNGEWEFYPMELRDSGLSESASASFIHVPGSWASSFSADYNSSYRYGTYRLRIWLPAGEPQAYSIRTGNLRFASAIYANGTLLEQFGHPSESEAQFRGLNRPATIELPAGADSIDLWIQMSSLIPKGGITTAMWFGTEEAVQHKSIMSPAMQLILCVVILLHGLYAIILFFLGPSHKTLIYFSLLVLTAVLSVLADDDRLLFHWLNLPFEWEIKLLFFAYMGIAAVVPPLIKRLFPLYNGDRSLVWFHILSAVLFLFVIFGPTQIVLSYSRYLTALLPLSLLVSFRTLKKAIKHDPDTFFLVFATSAIFLNVVWGSISGRGLVSQPIYYPVDLIIAFLCFAGFWFKRFVRASEQNRQLAARLQRDDKRKDQFLANTSHELRNPLHGMIHIAQSIREDRDHPQSERNAKNLELLVTIGKRMSYLLNDMMDATRLKEGQIALHTTPLDVHAVTAGVLEMVRFMTEGKPIRFRTVFPDSLPRAIADENRLVQVLLNLLHNAVKHTDEGEIVVSASARDGMVCVRVSDTGIGISDDDLKLIFQPYEQGQTSLDRAAGGFGLGLSISRQLVELHGGSIEASSIPGQGSTFSFTLPAAGMETGPVHEWQSLLLPAEEYKEEQETYRVNEAAAARYTDKSDRPVVLAVDDDPLNLTIIENVLGKEHYRLVKASSGSEALRLLEQYPADLVIADVMMPYMSGYELARKIRERFSMVELPVLLLTARSSPDDIYTGFHAGANDYVAKPVDSLELRSRVRALTDMKLTMAERLRLEAAWLQAQIKPHFLFNTLNSIAALGTFQPDKMQQLLDVFSRYLRISYDFHNSDRLVQLDRELELVRAYLYIEQERFGERLNVEWDIRADSGTMVPPLSIQPLVENAVNHGILKKAKGGTIAIQAEKHSGGTRIAIRDDGAGMSPTTVKRLLEDSAPAGGIGLRNTDRRLKQLYGRGLTITSKPGEGAEVSFHISENRE